MGFKQTFMKNLPTILTIAGCVGVGVTVFFAVKVTPEAKRRIDNLKKEKENDIWKSCEAQWRKENGYSEGSEEPDEADLYVGTEKLMNEVPDKEFRPAITDMAKEVAVLYLPSVLMGAASIAAFISANTVSVKRLTATSAALTATEEAFRTYKNKVVEQIGEKKAAEVIQKIVQEKVDKNPPATDNNPSGANVILTGDGETLFLDTLTHRYFRSDIEKIKRIINSLNARLIREDYISLNDYYDEIGLDRCNLGEELGWSIMGEGQIDVSFTSVTAYKDDDKEIPIPCLGVEFHVEPRYHYGELHRW